MARTLLSIEIPNTLDAPVYFGQPGMGGLLVARPARSWWVPYIAVPEGFFALVTYNGRELLNTINNSSVFPSGMIFAGPFTKVSHLVTKQTVIFDAPVKGCKTSDNVTVQIDVSVAFRIMGEASRGEDPNLVAKFVHQVTPAGLEAQLKDALAEEIRTLARSLKHTQVYACRTGVPSSTALPVDDDDDDDREHVAISKVAPADIASAPQISRMDSVDEANERGVDVTAEMKDRLNRQFEPQGVQISDVMIQDVVLPKGIVENMSNKSLVRSKQEYEMMEQQYEMQAITLHNEATQREVEHREDQEKAQTVGSRDTQAQVDALSERIAIRNRELKDYEECTRQEVDKLKAETEEQLVALNYEKKRLLQKLALEAEEEANKLRANGAASVRRTEAEAELTVAKHNGSAEVIQAQAESTADGLLKKARHLDLVDSRLKVYEALANNTDVVLSSSDDSALNTILLSDSVLNDGKAQTHEKLLAQLNVLRLASNAYGLQPGGTYIPNLQGTLGGN